MANSAFSVDSAFKKLAANFTRKFQSKDEAEEVKSNLRSLVSEFGETRFEGGIADCLTYHRDFFPTKSQLRAYILDARVETGVGQRCDWCRDNEGFIIETRPYPIPEGMRREDMENPLKTHQVARKCKHGAA